MTSAPSSDTPAGSTPGNTPAGTPPAPSRAARTGRPVGLISAATMLSRVLGLVREQFFAALLGASWFADAFNVAFRIPNLLRDLAEGALAQAFVPTFKSALKRDGKAAAHALANRVAGSLLLIVGLIVIAGTVFAPGIVHVMAGDFSDVPGKLDLTITLTRIMMRRSWSSCRCRPWPWACSTPRIALPPPALAPACFNVMSSAVGAGPVFRRRVRGVGGRGLGHRRRARRPGPARRPDPGPVAHCADRPRLGLDPCCATRACGAWPCSWSRP